MRRSVVLIQDSISDLIEEARACEEAGFDAVWLTDFYNRDVFVRMAMVGQATSRINVASGIAYAFARSPVMTAAAAADLDEITDSRIILGLGTGTKRMQESWYGLTFESPAPKAAEVIRLLRMLWSAQGNRPLKFDGRFYNIAIDLFGRPGRVRDRIPVYLAGVNRIMVRTAGEVADGLVGHPLYSRKYLAESVRPAIAEGLRRAERDASTFDTAGYVITSIAEDESMARDEARRQIAFYATAITYKGIMDLHGWNAEGEAIRQAFRKFDIPAMTAAVTDDMVDAIAVTGTPASCRAQLARYDGLLDHALLYPPTFGTRPDRVRENYRLIRETFGPAKNR